MTTTVRILVALSVVLKLTALGSWWLGGDGGVRAALAAGHGEAAPAKKPDAKAAASKDAGGHGAEAGAGPPKAKDDAKEAQAKEAEAKQAEAKKDEKQVEAARKEPEPVSPELLARSRGFRELLTAVDQRTADLAQREKALTDREAALRALEQTVEQQVARLEALTVQVQKAKAGAAKPGPPAGAARAGTAAGQAPTDTPETVAVVSKIYGSMKAEEAAPILDRMDDGTVREILAGMKERQIGAILAAMARDRAVAVTKLLNGPPAAP